MNKVYDKQYFIDKFSAIPDHLWITGEMASPMGACAFGHCSGSLSEEGTERNSLALLAEHNGFNVVVVNDGYESRYQQPTPKKRILAALRDLP